MSNVDKRRAAPYNIYLCPVLDSLLWTYDALKTEYGVIYRKKCFSFGIISKFCLIAIERSKTMKR